MKYELRFERLRYDGEVVEEARTVEEPKKLKVDFTGALLSVVAEGEKRPELPVPEVDSKTAAAELAPRRSEQEFHMYESGLTDAASETVAGIGGRLVVGKGGVFGGEPRWEYGG